MSMSTTKRIYLVQGGDKPRLIEASSQAQAIGHCVRGQFKASVASQREIVDFMVNNDPAEVEKASVE